ncbi:MAG: FAD-dependent oxidoreductase [Chloroflexi bacterium]|nr:FAD-dependent oxidoreductase [Chloroflexota bacterium]
MAVDEQTDALKTVRHELDKRYGADYEVICERSPRMALRRLQELKAEGRSVAVLLADLWMLEISGIAFLDEAQRLYPTAKRALLINWNDRLAGEPLLHAMTQGLIDCYATKPVNAPDEQFHRLLTELLDDWTRQHQRGIEFVRIVGERWSAQSHELRDLLNRYGIPFGFYETDSEDGQSLLRRVGKPDGPFPVVILFDGRVMTDPSHQEVADAFQGPESFVGGTFDLTIIGAGPAGLSAAVYGASEGLRTLVIEREAIGGQAGASSLIRNYLGFPIGISGNELANRAYRQAWLFGAQFYLLRHAAGLFSNGRKHVVVLSDGIEIVSRAVILAMGASYRHLGIPALEALTGAGVFYGGVVTEAQAMKNRRVFIAGAGNSAGQAAVHLSKYAGQVTILARGSSLSASMSDYLVKEIEACKDIEVRLNTRIVDGQGTRSLEALVLHDSAADTTETVEADALFVLIGAQPHTDWLPPGIIRNKQGFILTGHDLIRDGQMPEGWPLVRPPLLLETSVPGVFAVGDVRHRSVKRVASAVGEGSIVIQLVHEYLDTIAQRG